MIRHVTAIQIIATVVNVRLARFGFIQRHLVFLMYYFCIFTYKRKKETIVSCLFQAVFKDCLFTAQYFHIRLIGLYACFFRYTYNIIIVR